MSTTPQFADGAASFAAHELNITNVAGDYHDHRTTAYHNHNHSTVITIKPTSSIEPLDRTSTASRISYSCLARLTLNEQGCWNTWRMAPSTTPQSEAPMPPSAIRKQGLQFKVIS